MVIIEMSDATAGYINEMLGQVSDLAEQATHSWGVVLRDIDEERAEIEAELAGMLATLMAMAKYTPVPN